MENPKVAVVATYPGMGADAAEIVAHFGLDVQVLTGDFAEGVRAARKAIADGAEVIVSRSATAVLIAASVEVPVVEVEISPYDLVRCLAGLKDRRGPIGVIGFRNLVYGSASIGKMLGADIREIIIGAGEELPAKVAAAAAEGVGTIIGGSSAVEIANKCGLQGAVLTSGKEALAKAIQDALRIAEVRSREKARAELVKVLVDTSNDGIIAIDTAERVTLFNPPAAKLFNIRAGDIIGAGILEKFPDSQLPKVIRNKPVEAETLQKIGDKLVVINRHAIKIDNRIVGAFESIRDITEIQRVEHLVRRRLYARGLVARARLDDIVGDSVPVRALKQKAGKYAQTGSAILIMGESGTGKEILAQGIHNASPRNNGPFVAVNCAALPESLLESELFGYEEGAFTGARKGGKQGLFELAHGGTLFLDEIGEMPRPLQSRLLRVLQERVVLRIGGNSIIPVDVRIIAAANRNIHQLIEEGQFRADLYYRINTLTLFVPPLRERGGDIALLAAHFLRKHGGTNPLVKAVDPAALKLLATYNWPGNVRELEHALERLLLLAEAELVAEDTVRALLADLRADRQWGLPAGPAPTALRQIEADFIEKVLEEENYNKTKAAKRIGVSRSTLWRKLGRTDTDAK